MSLSCSCHEWDGEGVCFYVPSDFTTLKTTRRKRCKSCGVLIDGGSKCLIFERFRGARDEIEENIYGYNDIPMADWHHCEKCGEIFLNLEDLGFCLEIDKPMSEYLKEYQELTGFNNEINNTK